MMKRSVLILTKTVNKSEEVTSPADEKPELDFFACGEKT